MRGRWTYFVVRQLGRAAVCAIAVAWGGSVVLAQEPPVAAAGAQIFPIEPKDNRDDIAKYFRQQLRENATEGDVNALAE